MKKKFHEMIPKFKNVGGEVRPYIRMLISYELANVIWHYLISPWLSGR